MTRVHVRTSLVSTQFPVLCLNRVYAVDLSTLDTGLKSSGPMDETMDPSSAVRKRLAIELRQFELRNCTIRAGFQRMPLLEAELVSVWCAQWGLPAAQMMMSQTLFVILPQSPWP